MLLGLPWSPPPHLQPDLQPRKPWRGLEMGVAWFGVWPRTVPDRRRWAKLRNTRSTLHPMVPSRGGLGDQSKLSASENIGHR